MPNQSLTQLRKSREAQSRRIARIVSRPDSANEDRLRKNRDRLVTACLELLAINVEIKEREALCQEAAIPQV